MKRYWKWWGERHPFTQSLVIIGFYILCIWIIGVS